MHNFTLQFNRIKKYSWSCHSNPYIISKFPFRKTSIGNIIDLVFKVQILHYSFRYYIIHSSSPLKKTVRTINYVEIMFYIVIQQLGFIFQQLGTCFQTFTILPIWGRKKWQTTGSVYSYTLLLSPFIFPMKLWGNLYKEKGMTLLY